jgi:hypothetical protein
MEQPPVNSFQNETILNKFQSTAFFPEMLFFYMVQFVRYFKWHSSGFEREYCNSLKSIYPFRWASREEAVE